MLQDIFSALTSGASQGGGQSQTGSDALLGLVGSLLGGQTGTSAGVPTGTSPLVEMLTSGQNPMLNSLIQPVVDQVAQKLGIDPAIAMTVVTFAVHYMLTNHGAKLANGEDVSALLQKHTGAAQIQKAGLSTELANQTGMDPAAATQALSEVFKLLNAASQSK